MADQPACQRAALVPQLRTNIPTESRKRPPLLRPQPTPRAVFAVLVVMQRPMPHHSTDQLRAVGGPNKPVHPPVQANPPRLVPPLRQPGASHSRHPASRASPEPSATSIPSSSPRPHEQSPRRFCSEVPGTGCAAVFRRPPDLVLSALCALTTGSVSHSVRSWATPIVRVAIRITVRTETLLILVPALVTHAELQTGRPQGTPPAPSEDGGNAGNSPASSPPPITPRDVGLLVHVPRLTPTARRSRNSRLARSVRCSRRRWLARLPRCPHGGMAR